MGQNISDLDKLRSGIRKVNINGIDVEVKTLTFPELTKFAELLESKKIEEATNYILFTSLRKTVNGTDEEIKQFINELEASSTVELLREIQKASGIKMDDDKKKEV